MIAAMKRTSFANWPCSIARAMDLLGDWWTPLVLREAFYGIQRFDDFQAGLNIARNTLADRLRTLVTEGLMEKKPYQTDPVRYDYVLTQKGRDFFPVLVALQRWGDRWLADEAGPPIVLHHERCGHDGEAEVVCSSCGEPMTSADTSMRIGPGYPERLTRREDVRQRFGLGPVPRASRENVG
jgi:DNA-binding HxlR family transcriptional regulator